jgi:protein TonB
VRISILRIAVLVVSFALATLFRAAAEEVYNVGGDVTAPKLVHKVEPRYTKRAKKAKLKGTVSLSAVVNREGNPENIEIAKSLDLDLDAEAVKAVSHWRFKPAEKNGKPVAVRIKIQVNFRLCCSLF